MADLIEVSNVHPGPKYRKEKANYAFQGRVWPWANFECFRLSHCWRYDINGRLGKFLSALRLASVLSSELYEEMKALWMNGEVQLEEAVMLCRTKKDARVWSLGKLQDLDGDAVVYFGVDRQGSERRVNTILNEDDDLHDNEQDDGKRYYDEDDRTRSLFSSMPAPPVVRLRVGAKVLCTQNIDKHVKVGCMGTVVVFRDAAERRQDDLLTSRDMGFGMDQRLAAEDWDCVHPKRLWPKVEWNVNGKKMLKVVLPGLMNLEDNLGRLICSRVQLPLILSYSLTVHRAQGMTLDAVCFSLQGLFTEGQLYTALS